MTIFIHAVGFIYIFTLPQLPGHLDLLAVLLSLDGVFVLQRERRRLHRGPCSGLFAFRHSSGKKMDEPFTADNSPPLLRLAG